MPDGARRLLIFPALVAALSMLPWQGALAGTAPEHHVVQKGDTLYSIARAYGVTVDDLVKLNSISDPSSIQPGLQLVLRETPPPAQQAARGATYTVKPGDTVWSISRATGVPVAEINRLNGLRADSIIHAGATLILSDEGLVATQVAEATAQPVASATTGASAQLRVAAPALPTPQPRALAADLDGLANTGGGTEPLPRSEAVDADQTRAALGRLSGDVAKGFAWPVTGRITSKFGRRWGQMHEGLDIAVPTGTPVKAAADGVVSVAGYSGSYGYLVVVDHGDGWQTYYAHNSALQVKVGDSVRRGQVIARSGSTGNSTGPHVHFEVRQNGTPLDPQRFLN